MWKKWNIYIKDKLLHFFCEWRFHFDRHSGLNKSQFLLLRLIWPYAYHLAAAMTIYLVLALKQKRSQGKMLKSANNRGQIWGKKNLLAACLLSMQYYAYDAWYRVLCLGDCAKIQKKKHKGKQKDSQRDTQHIVTQTHTCARELCMLVCAKICKLSVATFVLAVFWCRKRKKQAKTVRIHIIWAGDCGKQSAEKNEYTPRCTVSQSAICVHVWVFACLPVSECRSSLLSPLCSLPLSSPLLFCFVSGSTRQHFYTFMLLAFNWILLHSQTLTSSVFSALSFRCG